MNARRMACTAFVVAGLVVVAAACLLNGCATYRYNFIDGTDGSSMSMHEMVLLGERDLARSQAAYEWTGTGGGHWTVGGASINPDTTEAIPMVQAAVEALRNATKLLIKVTGGVPL